MPSTCNIKQCGLKKNKYHPTLTMHRLPTNDRKKNIWIDAIGLENLNTNTKTIYICSVHFEESCFNRTLSVIQLREDAVPTRNIALSKATAAPTAATAAGSICSDCNDTHPITSTPLVVVDIPPARYTADIPPALPIETISPVIIEESPSDTPKESRQRRKCAFLNRQLRATKEKLLRKAALIDKLKAEKEELTKALQLTKGGETDPHFEDILHKAVMKLS